MKQGSATNLTGTVFVRVCLVTVWILGLSRLLQAGDWTQIDPDRKTNSTIVAPLRLSTFAPRPSLIRNRPEAFELKLAVASGDEIIQFAPPVVPDHNRFEHPGDPAGQARLYDPAGIDDYAGHTRLSDDSPDVSVSVRPIPSQPIPLDGVLRDEEESEDEQKLIPATRRISFGWLAGSQNNLGMLELDLEQLARARYDAFGTPRGNATIMSRNLKLHVDTGFGARWLNGPSDPDLPPYLFNVGVNVEATYLANDRFAVEGLISPSFYSDFSNKGSEAFRLPWRVVTYTKANDEWQWVLGVTDLSRQDIQLLPVTGFIYAPINGDVRYDLVFPKPRIARRLYESHEYGPPNTRQIQRLEGWIYLAGEIGGGSWAISRSDRSYDVVTYRDYRLFAGWETKQKKGNASRIEVGWIFGRAVQYQSNNGDYNPGDSVMIRMSSDY